MKPDPELYPFESRYFDRQGLKLHYLDEGKGEPLLMVHGNPTWSFYYRRLVQGLSDKYRCIVPDHIGCGLSDKPDDSDYRYTLKSRIDDLEALVNSLKLDKKITLVVHDWGGAIGMGFAIRHPSKIKRIVMFNTAAFNLPKGHPLPATLKLIRNTRFGAWLVRTFNAFSLGAAYIGFSKPVSPDVRKGYTLPYDSPKNRIATLRFVQDIPLTPKDPAYAVLADIESKLHLFDHLPKQFFWGGKDFVFDLNILAHWKAIWPNADYELYEDCGHYVVEDAHEKILPALQAFLQKKRLKIEDNSDANIARHLKSRAEESPYDAAVWAPSAYDKRKRPVYGIYNNIQLHRQSRRLMAGMQAVGIEKGMKVALMVSPGLDFFALTFALFRMGAIPVLIDPGMGIRNLKACIAEAGPEVFIGISKAHAARILLAWGRETIRHNITVGSRWFWGGYTLEQIENAGSGLKPRVDPVKEDDMAAILFTSGSTGVPKGVVYQHRQFNAQIELLASVYKIENGEVDLPTFPLFALFAPALGMQSVIPEMDATRPARAEPEKLLSAINTFGVNSMFGSPALLNRLGRYLEEKDIKLPSIRRVISAGASVPASVLERMARALPEEALVVTPYGATECLPVSNIDHHELAKTGKLTAQGAGVCVGKPLQKNEVHVIAIHDGVIEQIEDANILPAGQIGEIIVSGPTVTESYYNRPEATALAKIRGGDGKIYHRMGDVGYRDEKGRLWFCGRMSQRVITAEKTFYTDQCEAVFNAIDGIHRTALVGVGEKGRQTAVLVVESDSLETGIGHDKMRMQIKARASSLNVTTGIETVLFYPSLPVDIRHNAKIKREELARWAEGKL